MTSENTTPHQTDLFRVALGVSGGIAAYKAAEVLRGLQQVGCIVRVCMTARATEFIRPLTFRALSGAHVVTDDYAPDNPDPIAHITFSQTTDLLLVAPATANIIAKFANGIADDFLTSTYLASNAPVLVAPAMNTTMWEHAATLRNIERLRRDGVHIVEPDEGEMACGTTGPGRLAEPARIVEVALTILRGKHSSQDLRGEHILITTGATREAIDPVRFLSNRSSGRMGFALAERAAARGAEITVVAGVTSVPAPERERISTLRVITAEEMQRVVNDEVRRATVFIAAAAVSDYRPAQVVAEKIKKNGSPLTLTLEPTTDILSGVSQHRPHPDLIVVGFAAETNDVVARAAAKLARKKLDLIVANDVTQHGAGFESETNIVTIIGADHSAPLMLPLLTKHEVADRILNEVARLRARRRAEFAGAGTARTERTP